MLPLEEAKQLIHLQKEGISEITLGHSESQVFLINVSDKEKCVLKFQQAGIHPSLKREADNIRWLGDKLRVPEIWAYEELAGKEYLLMSFLEGEPSFAYHDRSRIGSIMGLQLKRIHSLPFEDFPHKENQTLLLRNSYHRTRPDQIPLPLPNPAPVFSHGDYCCPNVLIRKNGKSGLVDLGSAGIHDAYHDLYWGSWSLGYNGLEDQIPSFFEAYGLDQIDDEKMALVAAWNEMG